MSWVKLDDGFFRNRKARAAGPHGRNLYVAALCHCGFTLSDGFVSDDAIPVLVAEAQAKPATVKTLTDVGLWERVANGFLIPDYLEYNPSAEKVLAEREAAKERRKRGGTSGDVRENVGRRSGDVPETFEKRSATPSRSRPSGGSSPPSTNAGGASNGDDVVRCACQLLAEAEADRRTDIKSRSGWVRSRTSSLLKEHEAEAQRVIDEHPNPEPAKLAAYLGGNRNAFGATWMPGTGYLKERL